MTSKSAFEQESNSAFVSYATLLVALDRQLDRAPAAVEAALETRPLAGCTKLFGRLPPASVIQIQSDQVKLPDGTTHDLKEKEKAVALAASERFGVSPVDAAVLLRSKRLDQGRAVDDVSENESEGNEAFWDAFLVFYLNERLQVLNLVTQLLIMGDGVDEDTTIGSTVAGIAQSRAQKFDKRDLAANCITEFIARCSEPLPDGVRTHPRRAAFFAKQLVREQIALLTLAFVCCNQTTTDTKTTQVVLDAASKTSWGRIQANEAFFDADTRNDAAQVEHLIILLSVSILNLEVAALPPVFSVTMSPSDPAVTLHPQTLISVHQAILKLVNSDANKAAPLLLGWALVLHRLVRALETSDDEGAYGAFVKTESPASFHQQALGLALDSRCGLFGTLSSIISSNLTRGRYAVAFLDVLRGLLVAVPQMLYVGLLGDQQYSAYLATYIQLYSASLAEPLRERYWTDIGDPICIAEQSFVAQVEQRFPAQPIDTVRLLTALAAPGLFDHFAALPSLTYVVPSSGLFTPSGQATIASQAIAITRNVLVPARTEGRTLSVPGATPQIVCWDLSEEPWSGWQLLSDVLADAAGLPPEDSQALVAGGDPFVITAPALLWTSTAERDALVEVALDFFAAALEHENVQHFDDLLDVQVLFRLLGIKADAALRIIVKLLPLKANAIWITLQGMQFFPRSSAALLQADKARGTYSTTRALVDLAHYLFLEARNRSGGELQPVKAHVLEAALAWVRDDVWSAHRGWRYAARRERYELSEQLSSMMVEVVEETAPTSAKFARAMLGNVLRLAPILSSIATGASAVHILAAESKIEEADVVRRAVVGVLQLTYSLLSLRRHVAGNSPSQLERNLLALGQQNHISGLMRFVNVGFAEHSPEVAREAARVLAALTVLTVDWPGTAPSLLAHLDEAAAESLVELLDSDRFDRSLDIALWSFASAAVECQPGLAMLLVSGQPIRGDSAEAKPRKNAVSVAIEALAAADQDAELRAALYRFLDMAWQRIADYSTILGDLRSNEKLWKSTVEYITASPMSSASEVSDVAQTCFSALARASACNVLATDIRYACLSDRKSALQATSVKTFLAAFKSSDKLTNAAVGFLHSACEPAVLQDMRRQIRDDFPSLDLDSLRRPLTNVPALDVQRRYGDGYLYPSDVILAALQAIEPEKSYDTIHRVDEIDDIHALMDTQMLALMAWRRLLEEAKPVLRRTTDVAPTVLKAATAVAQQAALEEQSGDLVAMIHAERLSAVLALLDALPDEAKDPVAVVQAVLALRKNFDLDALSPLDSLRDRQQAAYHRPLLGAAFLLAQHVQRVTVPDVERAALSHALEDILRSALLMLQIELTAVTRSDGNADLALICAVVQRVVVLKAAPPAVTWLAYLLEHRVLPTLFAYIADMRPGNLYALALAVSLANFPAAAERMSTEGGLAALSNNALTMVVSNGHLAPGDGRHQHWVLSLTLAVVIASSVGARPTFMDELLTFARLVAPQLARAMSWKASRPLSLALLDETEATVSLLRCIATRPASTDGGVVFIGLLTPLALAYLDEAMQALQHLNTLVAAFETATPEERAWLDAEKGCGPLRERVVAGPVTQIMLGVLCQVLDILVAWTQAFRLLSRDFVDWPYDRLLQRENTKSSDLPCIGGLLELAGFAIDILNEVGSPKSALPSTVSHPPLPMAAFSPSTMRAHALHALESALLLATSQSVLVARCPKGEVREEVVDELVDWLRKGAGAVREAGGKPQLVEALTAFATGQLAVRP